MQEAVDDKKISLKVAEHLSFLSHKVQEMVASLIIDENRKITEKQAQILKEKNEFEVITKEQMEHILNDENRDEKVSITFSKSELKEFFGDVENKKEIKKMLVEMLRNRKISKSTPECT